MPHQSKLFVGNLPTSFKRVDLEKLFGHFGAIESFNLCPKEKSCFAFVSYKNRSHANEAKKQLNNKTIKTHQINVDFARSSNDLHIKAPQKNTHKRKFTALRSTSSPAAASVVTRKENNYKRRKITHTQPLTKSQKQVPKSRIIKIINIPKKVSIATLKQELLKDAKYQYVIYPAKDRTENPHMNVAWILHQNVQEAEAMIARLNLYIFYQSILRVSFVRKLNKLYRVDIIPSSSITKDADKMKQLINDYFSHNYKFADEEKAKSFKFNKYTHRRYKKKKIHDVIQNVDIKQQQITVEFKKADYALFAVQKMNGIELESQIINTRFAMESLHRIRNNENNEKKINKAIKPETLKTVSEKRVILKMFNIAKSVEYQQLKTLILSIIESKYYEHLIYPSPDSLPQSQNAWICLKDNQMTAHKLINQLNGTEINHESVGVVFMGYKVQPQKIMIRNLPDSITKEDIRKLLRGYGTISDITTKEKLNPKNNKLLSEHHGYAFVTFTSIKCAVKAMAEMNGHKIKNKTIAIDYTLPKEVYNKIRNTWNEHNAIHNKEETISVEKKVNQWQSFKFMKDDYKEKSLFSIKKKQKDVHREILSIPIASEPEDYDWLRWFLYRHRLTIIQYETNCKIRVNDDNIEIASCNETDLEKGVLIMKDMLNDKRIREIGYTQLMNIPFELEHADFDWILYLNGDDYEGRKEFECNTGCSFTFRRNNKLQIELIGATKQSLQRGAHYMKDNILSDDIKDRQQQLLHKYMERIHFKPNPKIRQLNMRQIQKDTKCKIRLFGSHVFANRKNLKSYFKMCAKTEEDLKNGCKAIRECIAKCNGDNNADDAQRDEDKKFWFYSGDANEERTVFVRNLPFEIATNDPIRDKFAEFGAIVSIKLVKDKISGNLNGSCFIQFDNKESAQNAIRNNQLISMNGRKLLVNIAVNKYEAKKMERSKLMRKDRRNLYLAKEGIMLNEKEMKEMDKKELDRRIKSWKEKQLKLQNPNFHVSKTRLSVQNIPPFVDEKYLRKIFYDKSMEIRKKMEAQKNDQVFEHPFAKINQVKIVRDATRMNKKSGIARSKRFGFVEFREHSDALLVLRQFNNKECQQIFDGENSGKTNPAKKMNGKLQVEFSVENMKKLHIHLEKRKKHQMKWQRANLEKLKDKLEILKAQNEKDEIKKVEEKINIITQNINNESYLKIKQKKAMLKMKKKDKGLIRKYKSEQNKKYRNRNIKRQ